MFRNGRICSIEYINTLLDHTLLLNIGSNTHAQIDTHLALTNEHIDWTNATDNLLTAGTGSFGEGLTVNANKTNQRHLILWGIADGVDARGGSILWRRSVIGDDPLGYTYINDNSQFVWDTAAQASSTDTGFAWVNFGDGSASFGDTALASLAADTDTLVVDAVNHTVNGTNFSGDNTNHNLFFGSLAGEGISGAISNNICIGEEAGRYLTYASGVDGYYNTYIGAGSGKGTSGNNKGFGNVGLGWRTLEDITVGFYNFGCGVFSLMNLTSGDYNIAMGFDSLGDTTTGNRNMALGSFAGSKNNGDNNIFLGHYTGFRQTATSYTLIIDSVLNSTIRASAAEEEAEAIIYGEMAAAPADQTLRINAEILGSVGAKIGDGGTTNYLSVSNTGDVDFKGGAGLVSGSFWGNEIGFIAAGGTGTYFEIFDSDITTGQLHNVTHNTSGENTLDIGAFAGMYVVLWSISAKATGANKHIVGAIGVDAGGGAGSLTAQNDGRNHAVSTGNAEFSLSGGAMLDLSANSEVGLMATNETDNTNVTIEHVSLVIGQWGGT